MLLDDRCGVSSVEPESLYVVMVVIVLEMMTRRYCCGKQNIFGFQILRKKIGKKRIFSIGKRLHRTLFTAANTKES